MANEKLEAGDEERRSLNIFLTGGTTGLGRAVTRFLAKRGHTVYGNISGSAEANVQRNDGGTPTYADIFDRDNLRSNLEMAQADVAIHLAGSAANVPPVLSADWSTHRKALIEGTEALVEAAGLAGTQRVLAPGFVFLYGDTGGDWADENRTLSDDDNLAFAIAREAEAAVLDGGVPGYVMRAGFLYGAFSEGTSRLHDALMATQPLPRSDAYANWTHEDDLALAFALAAERQIAEDEEEPDYIFNIVDDSPASPTEFVNAFADALGLAHPAEPPGFMRMLRRDPLRDALLHLSLRASNEKAKIDLGWAPRYSDHKAGIDQALMVWRASQTVQT